MVQSLEHPGESRPVVVGACGAVVRMLLGRTVVVIVIVRRAVEGGIGRPGLALSCVWVSLRGYTVLLSDSQQPSDDAMRTFRSNRLGTRECHQQHADYPSLCHGAYHSVRPKRLARVL